jgi:hypothetical protein
MNPIGQALRPAMAAIAYPSGFLFSGFGSDFSTLIDLSFSCAM